MTLFVSRVFNKYRISIAIFFFIGLILSYFFLNNLYDLTIGFNYNAPDIADNPYEVQKFLISQKTTLDCIANTYLFTMVAIPMLSFGLVILFFKEKEGLFKYRFVRGQSYKRVVISSTLTHSFMNALTFYIIYIIYFSAAYLIFGAHMNLQRTNMDVIFGAGFSINHPYIYYMIEGFIIYFLASFIYSMFGCCIAMLSSKIYNIILIPSCFYFGLSLLIGYVMPSMDFLIQIFQPFKFVYMSLNMFTTKTIMDFIYPILPLALPLVVSITMLMTIIKRREKLID